MQRLKEFGFFFAESICLGVFIKLFNLCNMYKQTLIDATKAGANELKRFFNGKFIYQSQRRDQ